MAEANKLSQLVLPKDVVASASGEPSPVPSGPSTGGKLSKTQKEKLKKARSACHKAQQELLATYGAVSQTPPSSCLLAGSSEANVTRAASELTPQEGQDPIIDWASVNAAARKGQFYEVSPQEAAAIQQSKTLTPVKPIRKLSFSPRVRSSRPVSWVNING